MIAGLKQAKAKGKKLGRPRVAIDLPAARALRADGLSYRVVASRLGVSVGTVYAALRSAGS